MNRTFLLSVNIIILTWSFFLFFLLNYETYLILPMIISTAMILTL